MLLRAPTAPSTVHSGSSAGPGTGTETRRQPLSVSEQRAAGWAPEEGGPETVARETAGHSQSAPAIRLGGGGRSMGRCCPLVVDGGAGGPARLCHQAAGGTADVSPLFQAPGQACASLGQGANASSCGEFHNHPVLQGGYLLLESASPAAPQAKESYWQVIDHEMHLSLILT